MSEKEPSRDVIPAQKVGIMGDYFQTAEGLPPRLEPGPLFYDKLVLGYTRNEEDNQYYLTLTDKRQETLSRNNGEGVLYVSETKPFESEEVVEDFIKGKYKQATGALFPQTHQAHPARGKSRRMLRHTA